MKRIDVSVSLDVALQNHPGHTPFNLDAVVPTSRGDRASVAPPDTRPLVGHGVKVAALDNLSVEAFGTLGTSAGHIPLDAGAIVIESLRLTKDAPARVVARKS